MELLWDVRYLQKTLMVKIMNRDRQTVLRVVSSVIRILLPEMSGQSKTVSISVRYIAIVLTIPEELLVSGQHLAVRSKIAGTLEVFRRPISVTGKVPPAVL